MQRGIVPGSGVARSGSELAAGLAQRLGLAYEDGGTYVLLSDAVCRVRIYPGTHVVSFDGQDRTLRGLLTREGRGVSVPGPAASLIEEHVARRRAARVVAVLPTLKALPQRPVVAPAAPAAVKPTAGPTLAPPALPASVVPDPGWAVAPTARAWTWIVLHHSDDTSGCLEKYHRSHLEQGWEHGCGYHFVIGNGSRSGDGEVEVSQRWLSQLHGAHAKTDDNRYNDHGIGICLVGNFEVGTARPTAAQMRALVRLTRWLMERYGIAESSVRGHCDCKATCCPGKNFPWSELRSRLRSADAAGARRPSAQLPPSSVHAAAAARPAVVASSPAPSVLGVPPSGALPGTGLPAR